MLFKSLLATCCVALLSALIDAGPIGIDAPATNTTTTNPSAMASSTPVDTSIHVPSTSLIDTLQYSVGYFGCLLNSGNCMNIAPKANDSAGYTHIIVPYSTFYGELGLESEYREARMAFIPYSSYLFDEEPYVSERQKKIVKSFVNNVKQNYPGVKVIISFGDLNFYYSNNMRYMVADEVLRQRFIESVKYLMQLCDVDGIDFAWKYPSSDDRRGDQTDKDNYFRFVKEMHEEFKGLYTISISLPPADAYIANGLNVELMAPYLDFITIMAYNNGPEKYEKGIGMPPHAAMKDVKGILNLPLS